jgi:hypothetical protein
MIEAGKVRVFVGAFSEFGGCVYRIPAPILGVFGENLSIPLQRGVGVRWRPMVETSMEYY